MIVTNAHGINNGEYPVLNAKGKDFFFADFQNASDGVEYILTLCSKRLPAAYGFDPYDIQVLSPSKKGIAGVHNINERLRNVLNPPIRAKESVTSATAFSVRVTRLCKSAITMTYAGLTLKPPKSATACSTATSE